MREEAVWTFAPALRTTASEPMSMRGPLISPM